MKKHNVSETGSVSVLRWGKIPTLLGPLERANLNPDDGQSPETQYFCVLYTIVGTL
jgi:hypothetical protein